MAILDKTSTKERAKQDYLPLGKFKACIFGQKCYYQNSSIRILTIILNLKSMENLVVWLAFASFVIFLVLCTIGTAYKSKLMIGLTGVFALLAFSAMLYDSPVVKWCYINDCLAWNIIITIVFTLLIFAVIYGLFVLWANHYDHKNFVEKAEKAGMTVAEFTRWRENTYERLRQKLLEDYGYIDSYLIQMMYEEEEQKLFNSKQ